ncbi:hypothetical protein Tsubulata_037262, partial [Turnera subulata]
PSTFSNLEQIESLDLSHNGLSGEIPQQLTQLNFLEVFIVSYYNLGSHYFVKICAGVTLDFSYHRILMILVREEEIMVSWTLVFSA